MISIDDIRQPVALEFTELNQTILQCLESQVPLINEIGQYLIDNGGKRIRPLVVLIAAKACGYQGKSHILLAAVIEFIHTATLLHDDVVDKSNQRRGQLTANAVWGNSASVLVGDFIYSRAFQMMVSLNNMQIMQLLSDTTNTIAEGEVLQLSHHNNPDITTEQYHKVISHKTAALFEAAAKLGGIISDQSVALQNNLAKYGHHLGIAFQLVDDVLDYQSPSKDLGKNIGDDLAEGKATLPVIWALKNGTQTQRRTIIQSLIDGNLSDLSVIQQAIKDTGALTYTFEQAQHHINLALQAIEGLADSPYKSALTSLAHFTVQRNY